MHIYIKIDQRSEPSIGHKGLSKQPKPKSECQHPSTTLSIRLHPPIGHPHPRNPQERSTTASDPSSVPAPAPTARRPSPPLPDILRPASVAHATQRPSSTPAPAPAALVCVTSSSATARNRIPLASATTASAQSPPSSPAPDIPASPMRPYLGGFARRPPWTACRPFFCC